jgi:hypothetical protein
VENGAIVNSVDNVFMTPLSRLLQNANNETKDYAALKVYLEKNEASQKGKEHAWVSEKLRLQHYF